MSKDIDISDLPPPDTEEVAQVDKPAVDISDLPPPEHHPGVMDAASALIGHMARGATFGYGDKISAGLESALTSKTYYEALKEQYAKQAEREKNFPALSKIGELTGLVASPLNKIAGAVAAPFNALSKIEQLEKVKKLIDYMKVAASGSALGAIAGEGYDNPLEKKDPNSMSSSAKGAIAGAVLGPVAKFAPWTTGGAVAGLELGPLIGDKDATAETVALAGLGAATDLISGTKSGGKLASLAATQAGKLMEVPQRVVEFGAEKLGQGIRALVPKELVAEEPLSRLFKVNASGSGGSRLIQQLKQVINTADLGNRVHSYEQAMKKAGDVAFKNIGDLTDSEKSVMYDAIQEAFYARGRNSYKPDVKSIAKEFEAYAESNPYVKNIPVSEYLKVKVKNDVETSLRAFANSMKLQNTKETIDSKVQSLWDDAIGTLGEIDKNVYNSNLQDFSKFGDTKKATFGDISMDLKSHEKTKYNKPDMQSSTETTISQSGNNADLNNPNVARKKLEDITIGKRAMNMAGAGLGAYNYDRPFWAGLGMVPLMSDFVAASGRSLQRKASEMNPAKISESFLSNPSFLKSIGQRNDSLGNLARSTFNDLQLNGQEGLKTKAFLFTMNPLFRKMILGDTTNKDRQNPESTSSTESLPPP